MGGSASSNLALSIKPVSIIYVIQSISFTIIKKFTFYSFALLITLQLIYANILIQDIIKLKEVKEVPYTPKKTWVKSEVIKMLAEKAIENDIKPKYLIELIRCESDFVPNVRSKGYLKSGKRENSWGLGQANLDVHDLTIEQATDPEFNIDWTIKHIKDGKAPQMWVRCHKVASGVK